MPYLTYVGPDLYRNGLAARGYWVFRRGKNVVVRFGAISYERGRGYRIKWSYGWNERIIRCASETKASQRLKALLIEKSHQKHGYRVLPSTKKIERARTT